MRVSPVLRVGNAFLQKRTAMCFCFYQPMLDPNKHIYMNHVPHNVYEDYWPIGQYPELHLIGSVAAATYQPRAQAILVDAINSRYNVKLSEEQILDQRWDQLFRHSIKTQQSHKPFVEFLLRRLATGIFVKESKWTWVKEQQIRLNMAGNMIQERQPQTIREFLEAYNVAIEQLVLFSHFGFSGNVTQSETAQERYYFEQLNDMPSGIPDLETTQSQNTGLINRLMKLLHSR